MARPPTFDSNDLLLVRRNPLLLALALSPLLIPVAWLGDGDIAPSVLFGVSILWIPWHVWARNPKPLFKRVAVRADIEGVEVGARRIPRAQIHDGLIRPGRPPRVLLRRRFGLPVELQLGSVDDGRALLRALGLDATQAVAIFGNRHRIWAAMQMAAMMCNYGSMPSSPGGLRSRGALVGLILIALVTVGMLVEALMLPRLAVGADGVMLSRLGRERFIGYGDIDVVRYEEPRWRFRCGVLLTLRSGEEVLVRMGERDRETGAMIVERIREALEVFHAGGGAHGAAVLWRGTRTVSAWLTSLRAIGAGANADMRTAPLPCDQLFRILEDPASPADERAAAAVAIGANADDPLRARLRSVADTVAAPRLRVAIEAAAGIDDAALEAALSQVEEEETSQPRRCRAEHDHASPPCGPTKAY